MTDKDSPFSMFSKASPSKKKPVPARPEPTPPKKEEPPVTPIAPFAESSFIPPPLEDEPVDTGDVQAMLDKIKKYRDDLTEKLDKIQAITGWDISGLNDYLSNPSNFKPAEWEMVKIRKEALESQFYQLLGRVSGGAEGAKLEVKKQEKVKSDKKLKGKSLGARKGWIPMR